MLQLFLVVLVLQSVEKGRKRLRDRHSCPSKVFNDGYTLVADIEQASCRPKRMPF